MITNVKLFRYYTVDDTYIELNHNHAAYPSMVKVRVKMSDGQDPGWYSDAQGGYGCQKP